MWTPLKNSLPGLLKARIVAIMSLEAIYRGYIKSFFQLLIIAATQKNH